MVASLHRDQHDIDGMHMRATPSAEKGTDMTETKWHAGQQVILDRIHLATIERVTRRGRI